MKITGESRILLTFLLSLAVSVIIFIAAIVLVIDEVIQIDSPHCDFQEVLQIEEEYEPSLPILDESLIWSVETTREPFYKLIEAHKVGESINQAYYDAIAKYSEEYQLDPEVVSALVAKECSYNDKAKHDLVKVKTRDGRVITRAIGAGVIFEIWKEELEDISIEAKEDLYDIDTNIKATCYILSILKDRRQLRGSKDVTQSMLLRYYGVIRRLGVLDLTYYNEVMSIKNKYIKG